MHAPCGVSPRSWGNCPPLSHRQPHRLQGAWHSCPHCGSASLHPPPGLSPPTVQRGQAEGLTPGTPGHDLPADTPVPCALTSRGGGAERASEGEPTHTRRAMLSTRGPAPHRHTRSARWGPPRARCSHREPRQGPANPHLCPRFHCRFLLHVLPRHFTPVSHALPLRAIPTPESCAGRRPGPGDQDAGPTAGREAESGTLFEDVCVVSTEPQMTVWKACTHSIEAPPHRRRASWDTDNAAGHSLPGLLGAGQWPTPR